MKTTLLKRSLGLACGALLLTGMLSTPVHAASKTFVSAGDTAIVEADRLYIRTGPGAEYAASGMLTKGFPVKIIRTEDGWGRIDDGWINLNYVDAGRKGNSSSLRSGYVTADRLNIRVGPGLNYQSCGALTNGYRVNILEYSNGWGRIDQGWIHLDYVSSSPSNTQAARGDRVKVTATDLNIRQGAGTGYGRNGSYHYGDVVQILETKGEWGRTDRGWICLNYTDSGSNSGPSYRSITRGSRVKVDADYLMVRIGPGRNYQSCGALTDGFRVNILEVDDGWGRISEGWICLDYVDLV